MNRISLNNNSYLKVFLNPRFRTQVYLLFFNVSRFMRLPLYGRYRWGALKLALTSDLIHLDRIFSFKSMYERSVWMGVCVCVDINGDGLPLNGCVRLHHQIFCQQIKTIPKTRSQTATILSWPTSMARRQAFFFLRYYSDRKKIFVFIRNQKL